MKRLLVIILFLAVLLFPSNVSANDYFINSFNSDITIQKDTDLLITETIEVNFPISKHGIFRTIPITYTAKGKTIRTKLDVINIENELGKNYQYQVNKSPGEVEIKIGDPDKMIIGDYTYVIAYEISKVVQQYQEHDEVYWNVTGSKWDTSITYAKATITSPYATIIKAECFAGTVGSQEKDCTFDFESDEANFSALNLGGNRDFSIVVGLSKQSQLEFPTIIEKVAIFATDNWGYLFSILPFSWILIVWYKKGRDKRFSQGGVYYKPDDRKTETKPLFAREHLPMVYHPIDGLTPAQIGTIIDERVDIRDVVAEIVELARLGYMRIKKIKKGEIIKRDDYLFEKLKKDTKPLASYQKYLLGKIFASNRKEIKLSEMKNKFYKHLKEFKDKLYQDVADKKIFDGNPDKVRNKYIVIFFIMLFIISGINFYFITQTLNFGPEVVTWLTLLPGLVLAKSMPRKTAWGYSLFRQITGLKYFLGKGKWRQEIYEKNLFIEEILPLAISLGVVGKLAKDMAELGVQPPSYFEGTTPIIFASDIKGFSSSASSSLVSTPGGTYSGGSGFSGGRGFSGGGFGGGGGGSW